MSDKLELQSNNSLFCKQFMMIGQIIGQSVSKALKLLDQVRERARVLHYGYKTEQSYVGWIKRLVLVHRKQHLGDKQSSLVARW